MSDKGKKEAYITYGELVPGYEFPPASYELNTALIAKYVKAVDSSAEKIAPPLAIAACAMAAMSGALSLPPGVIHASQEFEFFKLVPIGATVSCQARVAQKITRTKMRMLVLELSVFNEDRERVQSGKATIVLPVERADAE